MADKSLNDQLIGKIKTGHFKLSISMAATQVPSLLSLKAFLFALM